MPGIRNMSSSGADGAAGSRDGESKKRTYDGKLVNGERSAARKDTPAAAPAVNNPSSTSGVNGASMLVSAVPAPVPTAAQIAQLPPPLVHLASDQYHSLSKLLLRVSQECYNDLNEALRTMAELPPSHMANGGMPNGRGLHGMANGGQDNSEANRQKKLLLMRFAQDNRAKFIKLLVLSEWGRKSSADVSQLIDLMMWARDQSTAMDKVDWQAEQMKIFSNSARQYNPDIRTALEILATHKAGWIPDMGFIPPEPISSDKALKLLRYMNTSLSIRLTVHENLPRHLQKWRVGSGRAIFTVDDEFEFDVVSFVEDTSDQWHFIDLRLLFSPAPSVAVKSHFMQQLKFTLDTCLAADGLSGCFDYLHNFILTHKINVLRSQAYELLRTGWAGSLKVEQVHRGLVIQYWTDKPGKKSWFEIGISSNNLRKGKISWRGPPIPSLTVRWFRQCVEVKDVDLKFDSKTLSMERMVKRVIALHMGHLLRTTRQNLSPDMTVKVTLSETEPSDCMLEASMGSDAIKTTLSVEPVAGRYILRPITPLSSGAENAINRPKDTSKDASNSSSTITLLLARSLVELVQRYAQQLGWQQVSRQSLRVDVVKAAVKLDVLQYALYWPRGWSPNWALATIVDASGESWWICETASNGSTIEYAQRIEMEKPDGRSPSIDRSTLSSIERVAVHTIAFYVTTRTLGKAGKTYGFDYNFAQSRHHGAPQGIVRGWVLHIRTADLLTSKPDEAPWLQSGMRITCQGLRQDTRRIWHIASGTMVPDVAADMKKLMSASPQKNFSFSEDGSFSILLCTPFGEEIMTELKARLRDVDRLRTFVATLQKRKMPLKSSSLKQVQFQYGKSLTAAVTFGDADDIKVDFGLNNPHKRIHSLLTELINEKSSVHVDLCPKDNNGLDRFCTTLMLTRPILQIFNEIEDQSSGKPGNPSIHPHAIGVYRLTYANPTCSFDIRLKPKNDKLLWLIEDNEGKPPDFRSKNERAPNFKRSETLKTALGKLFRDNGERWYGVRTGIVAEVDGVQLALKKLHETVTSCYVEGIVKQERNDSGGQGRAAPTQPKGPGPSKKPGGGRPGGGGPPNGTQRQHPNKVQVNSVGGKQTAAIKHEVITIDD